MTEQPDQSDAKRDRDDVGRWLPGHSQAGPGRPKGPEFRRVVAERLAANGGSIDAVLGEIFEALRACAIGGDVQAARLLLDRLSPPEKPGRDDRNLDEIIGQTLELSDDQRAGRIGEILRSAAARRGRLPVRVSLNVVDGVPVGIDELPSAIATGIGSDPIAVASHSSAAPDALQLERADAGRGVGPFSEG
jgi:hypothetical protein